MTVVFIRERRGRVRHQETGKTAMEDRQLLELHIQLLAQQCQGSPATARSSEEVRKDSLRAFRGSTASLTTQFWTSSLQDCERINFCCFEPPSLG